MLGGLVEKIQWLSVTGVDSGKARQCPITNVKVYMLGPERW